MQIHTTDSPAQLVGEHLTESISQHEGDVLCLLSGGSALDVVQHIQSNKSECRTIFMMGDERVSGEGDKNNFLQLQARYPEFVATQEVVETVPVEEESIPDFAKRVEKKLLKTISELNNPKIIALFGMGADGHTAGIFPLPESEFSKVYAEDKTYVPVYLEGLTIDSRASITPSFIRNQVNEAILYINGNSKSEMLKSLMNESKLVHKRPAELIKQQTNSHLYTDQSVEML